MMMAMHNAQEPAEASAIYPLDIDDDTWDRFVAGEPNGHLLQTSHWGAFKARAGWEATRVAVACQHRVVAGAQILFRPLPLGQRLAYIPKGPVGAWWQPAIMGPLFDAIHQRACQRGVFMLKVEPEEREGSPAAQALERAGFRPSTQTIQPRSTIWIDLSASEDEILARMKPKTRYNIGLASRKGVVVREGGLDDLPAFSRLMAETGRRDGFAVHAPDYYLNVYRTFSEIGACTLFVAMYQDQMLAGLMAFAYGDKAWYLYGASSSQERQRMPNHALQWAAITWARRRGCRIYDLWGIPDEVGQAPERYAETVTERSDGLWGVYRFKQGFGGDVVRYLGAYDYIYAPWRYRAYALALKLRQSRLLAG